MGTDMDLYVEIYDYDGMGRLQLALDGLLLNVLIQLIGKYLDGWLFATKMRFTEVHSKCQRAIGYPDHHELCDWIQNQPKVPLTLMFPQYQDRDYLLFAHLAGVRNTGQVQPFSLPRGLPADCSSVSLALFQSPNWDIPNPKDPLFGFSHGWLLLSEFIEDDQSYWNQDLWSNFPDWELWIRNLTKHCLTHRIPLHHCRLVFAFDS